MRAIACAKEMEGSNGITIKQIMSFLLVVIRIFMTNAGLERIRAISMRTLCMCMCTEYTCMCSAHTNTYLLAASGLVAAREEAQWENNTFLTLRNSIVVFKRNATLICRVCVREKKSAMLDSIQRNIAIDTRLIICCFGVPLRLLSCSHKFVNWFWSPLCVHIHELIQYARWLTAEESWERKISCTPQKENQNDENVPAATITISANTHDDFITAIKTAAREKSRSAIWMSGQIPNSICRCFWAARVLFLLFLFLARIFTVREMAKQKKWLYWEEWT